MGIYIYIHGSIRNILAQGYLKFVLSVSSLDSTETRALIRERCQNTQKHEPEAKCKAQTLRFPCFPDRPLLKTNEKRPSVFQML